MSSDQTLNIALSIFNHCASFTSVFVIPLALIRIATANATGGSSSDYAGIIKGVVLYFILIHSFEPILKLLLDLPEAFGLAARPEEVQATSRAEMDVALPMGLSFGLETLASALYYVAVFLNFAFTVILASLAPVIFLLGAVLGIGLGLRVFFGLLIMVSSWPIVWTACDAVLKQIEPGATSTMGVLTFEIVCLLLKIAGPLALSYFGANSSPVGQAISKTVGMMNFGGGVFLSHAQSFYSGAKGSDFNKTVIRNGPTLVTRQMNRATHSLAKRVTPPASRVTRAMMERGKKWGSEGSRKAGRADEKWQI